MTWMMDKDFVTGMLLMLFPYVVELLKQVKI